MVIEVPDITAPPPLPPSYCAYGEEEDAIREWESTNNAKLRERVRKIAIEAYRIHNKENRRVVRDDIVNLGYREKYAKKILYECQKNKLLIPLDGYKQGRYKEYFLSTEIGRFIKKKQSADLAQQQQRQQKQSLDTSQISVIQILVNEIAQRQHQRAFHKPIIHVKIVGTEIDQTYGFLSSENGWIVKSQSNKAKVKSFGLESKRSCTFQVYPNGKVIVALECSYRPFRLYETDDCREFFETVGKMSYILGQEFGGPSIIPPTGEWLLKQYDMDITIPESELIKKYPYVKHWYSQEGIKIKALGHVFQIYGKIMPVCGKCLRIEEQVSIKEDVPLEQAIAEAANRPLEISNAFDLFDINKEKNIQIDR